MIYGNQFLTLFRQANSKNTCEESGPVNLINEEITHKVFGEGSIVDLDEDVITVDFNNDVKKFVYPDALGKFLKLKNREIAKTLKKVIAKREQEKEALEREKEEAKAQLLLEQQRREKLKNLKIHESSQIVIWLDEEEQQQVFNEWLVSTGTIQSGANKGQPNKAARLRPNSACILTARESDVPETERRIMGLCMVLDSYIGEIDEEGMIPAHEEFRIRLSEEEASKMLFWNYYINKNHPHRMTWNAGRFRYFDNVWTAQMLKDIIALKKDQEEVEQAERFLTYFCEMNLLDRDNIPEASGALKQ